ncbi:MAG: ROK family protein [Thermoproteota archaeon]
MECYVGVDIGGTWIRVLLANRERILYGVSQLTVKRGTELAISEQLKRLIHYVLERADVGVDDLSGIGISSCGPFRGMVSLEETPNICDDVNNWHIIPIIEPLMEEFGKNLCYRLENDAKAAALAENLLGAARGEKNCVYMTISTGVGGGFIIDGILCEGKNGNAAHVGHMIIVPDGPICGCGQKGCLEAMVSGASIARRAREKMEMEKGQGSIMWTLCGRNLQNLTAKEVFDAARLKDLIANEVVEETIKYLGIGIINVINVTDAAVVVLGGAVMSNHDLILEPLRKFVKENSFTAISRGTEIRISELGRFVGTVAGLSLVVPDGWIKEWSKIKPWEKSFQEVQL